MYVLYVFAAFWLIFVMCSRKNFTETVTAENASCCFLYLKKEKRVVVIWNVHKKSILYSFERKKSILNKQRNSEPK